MNDVIEWLNFYMSFIYAYVSYFIYLLFHSQLSWILSFHISFRVVGFPNQNKGITFYYIKVYFDIYVSRYL